MQNPRLSMLITRLLFLIVILFLFIYSHSFFIKASSIEKAKILTSCPVKISQGGHKDTKDLHYHAWLKILQDSKAITIPANLGIAGDCIRPIHTHDISGRIHIDYPKKVTFTLGDFFDVLGQIYNDTQIGNLKTADGYKLQLFVNGREVKTRFRDIILKDEQEIKVVITSQQS